MRGYRLDAVEIMMELLHPQVHFFTTDISHFVFDFSRDNVYMSWEEIAHAICNTIFYSREGVLKTVTIINRYDCKQQLFPVEDLVGKEVVGDGRVDNEELLGYTISKVRIFRDLDSGGGILRDKMGERLSERLWRLKGVVFTVEMVPDVIQMGKRELEERFA